jgi:hypothetical protein
MTSEQKRTWETPVVETLGVEETLGGKIDNVTEGVNKITGLPAGLGSYNN